MNLTDPITDEIRDIFRCIYGFKSARNRLIMSHQYIVTYEANRYYAACRMSRDDLIAEFNLHLLIHSHQIKWTPGYRFAYFVKSCLRRYACQWIKYHTRGKRTLPESTNVIPVEWIAQPTDRDDSDDIAILKEAVASLDPTMRQWFYNQYNISSFEYTNDRVFGLSSGINKQTVNYRRKSAINFIKQYIKDHHPEFGYSLKMHDCALLPDKYKVERARASRLARISQ